MKKVTKLAGKKNAAMETLATKPEAKKKVPVQPPTRIPVNTATAPATAAAPVKPTTAPAADKAAATVNPTKRKIGLAGEVLLIAVILLGAAALCATLFGGHKTTTDKKVVQTTTIDPQLQKQIADLQRQLNDANKAIAVAKTPVIQTPVVQAPVASAPRPSVSYTRANNSSGLAFNFDSAENGISGVNVSVTRNGDQSASDRVYANEDLASAKEKVLQIKDQIKYLRKEIGDARYSGALMRNASNERSNPSIQMAQRRSAQQYDDQATEMQEKLAGTTAELARANADVARISRALIN